MNFHKYLKFKQTTFCDVTTCFDPFPQVTKPHKNWKTLSLKVRRNLRTSPPTKVLHHSTFPCCTVHLMFSSWHWQSTAVLLHHFQLASKDIRVARSKFKKMPNRLQKNAKSLQKMPNKLKQAECCWFWYYQMSNLPKTQWCFEPGANYSI